MNDKKQIYINQNVVVETKGLIILTLFIIIATMIGTILGNLIFISLVKYLV